MTDGAAAPARSAAPLIVRDALNAAVDALTAAGCDTPRLDAEVLLVEAMNPDARAGGAEAGTRVDRAQLISDPSASIPPAAARVASEFIRRRVVREPVAYIIGRKEFRYISVVVDRRVLIPRPESELLVEVALSLPDGARVHDVGTGSGAIALAIKGERADLFVTASDSSAGAVEVARANASRLGLTVDVAHAAGLPDGDYDLVVANLPYVREDEWAGLSPEITRWEPREALVAGADGLDAIRALVHSAPAGTRVALEHAPAQADAVASMLESSEGRADLSGRPRVTIGFIPVDGDETDIVHDSHG